MTRACAGTSTYDFETATSATSVTKSCFHADQKTLLLYAGSMGVAVATALSTGLHVCIVDHTRSLGSGLTRISTCAKGVR